MGEVRENHDVFNNDVAFPGRYLPMFLEYWIINLLDLISSNSMFVFWKLIANDSSLHARGKSSLQYVMSVVQSCSFVSICHGV